jgi:hypothetical protein
LRRLQLALVLGAAAFCAVAVVTAPPGPGLDPDAMSYLGAAESLVGRGAYRIPTASWAAADSTEPLVHFPPGFSTLIAAPVALGMRGIQAGRLVDCVSAFATAALVFLIVEMTAGVLAGVLAAVMLFATPAVLGVYMSVLSEPPFLVALLATLFAMLEQRRQPLGSRAYRLAVVGAGLAAGAAIMLRYAGVAVAGAAVLWPLMPRAPWRRRVSDALMAGTPAAALVALWVYRCYRVVPRGGQAIRTFQVYGGTWRSIQAGVATLRDAVIPGFRDGMEPRGYVLLAGALCIALVAAVVAGARAALRESRIRGEGAGIAAAALMATIYIAVLLVSRALADPGIPFDERLLAPVIVLLELVVIEVIAHGWRRERAALGGPPPLAAIVGRAGRRLAGGLWLLLCIGQIRERVSDALSDGYDLAETRWRTSDTIDWVRANGSGYTLYTNWPAAVYFHAHRATRDLPTALDALTLRRFHDRLVRQHGVLVAIDERNPEMADPDSLAAKIPLQRVAQFRDGVIWGP